MLVCRTCWLVQTEDVVPAEALFNNEYAYFSSYSGSWLKHAEAYVADMVDRTSTDVARWHLIPAQDKLFGRIEVLRRLNASVEAVLDGST